MPFQRTIFAVRPEKFFTASKPPARPVFTHIRGNSAGTVSLVTTISVVLNATPVAGNLLVVGLAFDRQVTNLAVSDSNGNAYTVSPTTLFVTGCGEVHAAYVLSAPANASATITATWTTVASIAMWVEEFNTGGRLAVLDTVVTGQGASGTTVNTPTFTPAAANELVFAISASGATTSAPTAGSTLGSWIGAAGGITNGDGAEYATAISAATAVQFTQSTAAWAALAIGFLIPIDAFAFPTGSEATGAVGTVSLAGDANVEPTGVSATGQVGDVSISGSATVTPTGVSATGQVGTVSITGSANVSLTGVSATGAVGNVAISGSANVALTGVTATGRVGNVTISGSANVAVVGVSATGHVGNVTLSGDANINLSGVSATGQVGTVALSGNANVNLTGVTATGQVGTVTITTSGGGTGSRLTMVFTM